MSHHYSGPNIGFPRGDARLDLTDLSAFPKPGDPDKSILKTGKARAIRFSTLNAICGALSCQPGDILRFKPEAQREPASNEENFE
jgi:hypothetical protein